MIRWSCLARGPRGLVPFALALCACSSGGSGGSEGPGPDVLFAPFKGQQRVLFVVAYFLDAPPLFSATPQGQAAVQNLADTLAGACLENSRGVLQLGVDVTWPPVLIPKDTASYVPGSALVRVRADALEAARLAGWDAGAYDREVILAPDVWPGQGRGLGRTAWVPFANPWVLFHEIGHTLGWGHADFWDGDPTAAGLAGAGNRVQYGDVYDPMGTGSTWTGFHRSGPWFAQRAGWIPAAQVVAVTQSGTYTVQALDPASGSGGPLALRIRRDADNDYWVFYRSDEPPVAGGAVIVLTPGNPLTGSLLLDMNSGSAGSEVLDAALAPGGTFDDSTATGIVIQNLHTGPGAVTLGVTVDEARQAALDVRPLIGVTAPAADEGPVSGLVDFTVVASDPDAGSSNGEGIERVDIAILDAVTEVPVIVATQSLPAPPYVWSFDTSVLEDADYYLAITAVAADGGARSVTSQFLVDNLRPPRPVVAGVAAVGWVRDERGNAVPDARVEVTTPALPIPFECPAQRELQRWTSTSDAAGCYAVEGLPLGRPLDWLLTASGGLARARASLVLSEDPQGGVVVLPDFVLIP